MFHHVVLDRLAVGQPDVVLPDVVPLRLEDVPLRCTYPAGVLLGIVVAKSVVEVCDVNTELPTMRFVEFKK